MLKKTEFQIQKHGLVLHCLRYSGSMDCGGMKYAVAAIHGFAGHKVSVSIEKMARKLIKREEKCMVVSFDLPGHGEDRETLSLELCDRYIAAVTEYLREQAASAELILYGTSFGGYLAIRYLNDHPAVYSRCILRCPAVKMADTLKEKLLTADDLRQLEEGRAVESGFDMKVRVCRRFVNELEEGPVFEVNLGEMADRTLILQGLDDELVDCADVTEFAERNGAHLILSPDADHRYLRGNTLEESLKECVRFICG